MDLICFKCKKTWDVSQAHILGAKLKFGLGFKEHAFTCPNCDSKNIITKEVFEVELKEPEQAAAPSKPVNPAAPGPKPTPRPGVQAPKPAPKPIVGMSAPAAPVVGAGPVMRERHGVVIVRSLRVRKDHSTASETMAGLVKGEKVTITSTWTDGENTWAQLGPDRWAAIVYNGEALIELSN